jgi:stage II sporulation protein D
MLKKCIAVITVVFLIVTMLPSVLIEKAFAYQNNSYFNNLRVGLTSIASTNLTVTLNGNYTINGQAYTPGTILNLSVNGTSINLNDSIINQVNIIPANKTDILTMTTVSVSNKYMGSFLIKVLDGKLLPINFIDMESYLKGVVGYEMSDYFPIEALKAQAVAARNYALSRIGWENAKGFDFDDTVNYQVYKGYNPNYARVISAVEQTTGQILLYNDKLVETLYSAWHGGVSEDSENVWGNFVPYLRSVQDSYENDSWPNGNRVLTNAQIQSTLIARRYLGNTDVFLRLDLNSITRYSSGRVAKINIVYKNALGTELTKSVVRDNTRTFLGLPSNMYTVSYDATAGVYTFTGKGNGHGLGMSQIGAKNRATAGQTYEQILKFYFQNSYLDNLILKASISSLNLSSSTGNVGDKITASMSATGGNGYGYLYKYIIKNGSGIVYTRDYSSDTSFEFTAESLGSYTVEAYVKDKFSILDYDDIRTTSFIIYEKVITNSLVLNKQKTIVGQPVEAITDVQGGSGVYLYKYEVVKEDFTAVSTDFSTNKHFEFVPVEAGNYLITVYVKDSISAKEYDTKQSQGLIAYNAVGIDSIIIDPSVIFAGDSVNLSAITSGGSENGILYKYVITKDEQITSIRDFNQSNSYIFIPDSPGNYVVEVFAADSVSENTYDAVGRANFSVIEKASVTALTINKEAVLVNDSVVVTAASSSENSLYKFIASVDGIIVATKDYSEINTFQFTPQVVGNNTITAYIKNAQSKSDFDGSSSVSIRVYEPQIGNVTAEGYFYEGKRINFTATGTGVSPYGFNYRYEVLKDGTLIAYNSFNAEGSFGFVPTSAGNYTVIVYGRDELSSKGYDSMKQYNATVDSKPLYLSKLPLKQGMSGSDVTALQNALTKLGYNVSKEKGYFGTQTKNAVASFQKNRKLTSDGIVGNVTYGVLNDALIEKVGVRNITY